MSRPENNTDKIVEYVKECEAMGIKVLPPEINESIEIELRRLYKEGYSARKAVSELSQMSGIPRNKLYQTWLKVVKGD